MNWFRTSIAYTTTLCDIFNRDDNQIAQECRICSYGYQDVQFVICYETYYDKFDNRYCELSLKNSSRDYIFKIDAKDELIAYEMFRELCSDKFISALFAINCICKKKKEFVNQLKLELNKFFNERNYKEYEVEFY